MAQHKIQRQHQQQEQEQILMSSIRVSNELRLELAKIKAHILIDEGKDLSMEELIKLLVEAYKKQKEKEK
ncbi:MAG TPA: hypothetical protein VFS97_13570 [Nitrososphaeraceae archaeon]|nr:hypothetical protein [Nitrososphaeraceae archaeon]